MNKLPLFFEFRIGEKLMTHEVIYSGHYPRLKAFGNVIGFLQSIMFSFIQFKVSEYYTRPLVTIGSTSFE